MAESQADTGGKENILAHCICRWKKKNVNVTLTDTKLLLIDNVNQSECSEIRVADVLLISTDEPATKGTKTASLNITCVKQNQNLELKQTLVTLESEDQENLKHVSDKLMESVSKVEQRPKKLLVFINPRSGRSKGPYAYETVVGPVFSLAGIETDVIVTERAHHTEEILAVYDLESISGIVIVGGDGLYHEVVNGLMMRRMKELDRNVDDPSQDVPEIDLPLGLIPCGTGNGIAHACYGNYDVLTAALSIVLGYTTKFSVLPVHCDGKLLCYSALLVGYGKWGDLIHASESTRHLGLWRYPLGLFQEFLIKSSRQFDLTINWKGKVEENSAERSVDVVTKERTLRQREDLVILDGTEFKVTLDDPNAPGTELSTLEHFIDIDGESKKLSSPAYYYRLCSNKLNLFCNLPFATGRRIEDKKL